MKKKEGLFLLLLQVASFLSLLFIHTQQGRIRREAVSSGPAATTAAAATTFLRPPGKASLLFSPKVVVEDDFLQGFWLAVFFLRV